MASASKSKNIYSPKSSTYYYILTAEFVENSTSTENNTSNITVTATIHGQGIGYSGAGSNTWSLVWVDNNENAGGTTVKSEAITSLTKNTSKSMTHTFDVPHKSDGTLSGYVQVNYNNVGTGYAPSSNSVATDSTGLTNIPRHFSNTPQISLASKTETSLTFNWSTSETCNWIRYHFDGSSGWHDVFAGSGTSGQFVVYNGDELYGGGTGTVTLNANTTHSVYAEFRRQDSSKWSNSNTATETTHDYPKPTSLNDFNIGDGATVRLYNPLNRYVTLQILQTGTNTVLGTYTGTYEGDVNAEFKTTSAITSQYNSLTGANNSGTYYAKVTYNNIVKTNGNKSYYATEAKCKPTVSATIEDVDSLITTLTNDPTKIVKGFSKARITASATKISDTNDTNTTISKYTINGVDKTSSPYRLDIPNADKINYPVTVTNSRGYTSEVVYPTGATMHPYIDVTAFADFDRPVQTGTQMTVNFNGNFYNDDFDITNHNNHNTLTLKWYVRLDTSDNWTLGGTFVENTDYTLSGNTYTSNSNVSLTCPQTITSGIWDYMTQYYFKFEASDVLETVNYEEYVKIGQPYFDWWTEGGVNYFNVNGEYLQNNQPFSGGGVSGDTLPIGAILPYPAENAPTNWLVCDGSAVSRTTYAELFAIIGTSYGVGDGSTTFNLPDIEGRVVMGGGTPSQNTWNGYGTLTNDQLSMNFQPATLGEYTHQLNISEMPSHNHHMTGLNGAGSGAEKYPFVIGGGSPNWDTWNDGAIVGGDSPHNNIQPSLIVKHWIIKAFQSSGVVAEVENTDSNSEVNVYSCKKVNTIKSGLDNSISNINTTLSRMNTYSTSEVDTGEIWIDGKHIYKKTIETITNGTYTEGARTYTWIPSGINPDTVVDIKYNLKGINRQVAGSSDEVDIVHLNDNRIQIGVVSSIINSSSPIKITLKYTK